MNKAKRLKIAEDFSLPLDIVTQTQAILARKRSGKSYTAGVEAEEMLELGAQIGVFDPTGAWWGLRSTADGKRAGYQIVVFGGDHGDAPLDFRSGKAMCTSFVELGFSAIFDISNFATDEQMQFVMDFCAELLRINRDAVHIFMDEADTFAPQTPRSPIANKCLGTVSRLVKQGGIRGVGFTMITQRSASINWDVLSQIDMLVVLRMSAPHDIKPVVNWLQSETTPEFADQVKAELPRLPVGTAFFASAPLHIAQRVEVRTKRTFNSGATPKPGERKLVPKVMADIDFQRLGTQIAASVEQAKANSPEELKRRIRELEAAAKKTPAPQSAKAAGPVVAEKVDKEKLKMLAKKLEVLSEGLNEATRLAADREQRDGRVLELVDELRKLLTAGQPIARALKRATDARDQAAAVVPDLLSTSTSAASAPRKSAEPRAIAVAPSVPAGSADRDVNGGQAKLLDAIAWLEDNGFPPNNYFVAFLSGFSPTSSHFQNLRGSLRTRALVEYVNGETRLTADGRSIAAHAGEPLSLEQLHAAILAKLDGGQVKLLQPLLACYPEAMASEDLATAAGFSGTSSHFQNLRGSLRSLGLVDYPTKGSVKAAAVLFPDGK